MNRETGHYLTLMGIQIWKERQAFNENCQINQIAVYHLVSTKTDEEYDAKYYLLLDEHPIIEASKLEPLLTSILHVLGLKSNFDQKMVISSPDNGVLDAKLIIGMGPKAEKYIRDNCQLGACGIILPHPREILDSPIKKKRVWEIILSARG